MRRFREIKEVKSETSSLLPNFVNNQTENAFIDLFVGHESELLPTFEDVFVDRFEENSKPE